MPEETHPTTPADGGGEPKENDSAKAIGPLIREALDSTRDLVRLEVALARSEVSDELSRARASGIAFGAALTTALSAFTMVIVAVALAFRRDSLAALVLAAVLFVSAGVLALVGRRLMPKKPMPATRDRVTSEVSQLKQLKERIA